MGTKLGNIHVAGASMEEVAALLPGALVRQWSERFVSAFSEYYQLGMMDKPARAVSKKLPQAVVVTAAIFDSDQAEFALYQGGKRLTVHFLDPYEGGSKAGKPELFTELLGLLEGDAKRLKTVWKKGDADEQLELTGLLIGIPTWFDAEYPPDKPVARDVEAVDQWIAERPDPPRIKNITKAVCVQEMVDVDPNFDYVSTGESELCRMGRLHRDENGWEGWPISDVWLYRTDPDGLYRFAAEGRIPYVEMASPSCVEIYPGHVIAYVGFYDPHDIHRYVIRIIWDLLGNLTGLEIPLADTSNWWGTPDGGLRMVACCRDGDGNTQDYLIEYGPDRTLLRKVPLPGWRVACWTEEGLYRWGDGKLYRLDWKGDILSQAECGGIFGCHVGDDLLFSHRGVLTRWDRGLKELARSPQLTDDRFASLGYALSPDGKDLYVTGYRSSLWRLDAADLSVQRELPGKLELFCGAPDAQGRLWFVAGASTLECYDRDLNVISRHRLKGEVYDLFVNGNGVLTAHTFDRKRSVVRVFHIQ